MKARAEPDIVNYRFDAVNDSPGIESDRVQRFYERTAFIGIVFDSGEERRRQALIGDLSRFQTRLEAVISEQPQYSPFVDCTSYGALRRGLSVPHPA